MHIKANEKISLEIQIGHIYMLKMPHLDHFSGSGCGIFLFFVVWLGLEGDPACERGTRIRFVRRSLEMNAINIPLVQKCQKW